jgi:hypothetical protein
VPLAWLTIAGVVYGQAVSPQGLTWESPLAKRARTRYGAIPQRVRRRIGDLGSEVGSRFRPLWKAVVLMWRGGPILIGGYVLLYSLILLSEQLLRIGLTRLVGPQDFETFWLVAGTPLLLLVPLVIEPVRTALVASAYDATVGVLIGEPVVASGNDDESEEGRQLVDDGELHAERAGGVAGDEERRGDGVGTVGV